MATLTTGYSWNSGDTVTPALLNQMVNSATITEIGTSELSNGAVTTVKVADSAITGAKVSSTFDISNKTVVLPAGVATPAGAVMAFAMNSAPNGWLACNGSNVSRTTYAALFSAIGTTYGSGDGSTTFALPDLRGYFLRGSGTNSDGTAAGTFGEKQADGIKEHSHRFGYNLVTGVASGNGPLTQLGGATAYDLAMVPGTSSTDTRPKNIAMLYCIKF